MYQSKQILGLLISFFLLVGFSSETHAQSFEGIITYEFPGISNNKMTKMDYMIKDSKIRMQFGQGPSSGAMIYLPEESKMVTVIDQMKGYMETDIKDQNQRNTYSGKWQNTEMTKTGKTKTIAGYTCTIWQIKNDDGDTLSMCMAEGLGTFMTPGSPMSQRRAPDWAKKIVKEGYMPLEVIEQNEDNDKIHMRATNIQEKSIDSSKFTIPEGYRDISGMLKQMQNRNNN